MTRHMMALGAAFTLLLALGAGPASADGTDPLKRAQGSLDASASWHGRLIQRPHRDRSVRAETTTGYPDGWKAGAVRRGAGYGRPSGSKRVREVQRSLWALGYRPGPVDGLLGPRTTASIRAFEGKHGLERDGVMDAATLGHLRARLASSVEAPAGADVQPTDSSRDATPVSADAPPTAASLPSAEVETSVVDYEDASGPLWPLLFAIPIAILALIVKRRRRRADRPSFTAGGREIASADGGAPESDSPARPKPQPWPVSPSIAQSKPESPIGLRLMPAPKPTPRAEPEAQPEAQPQPQSQPQSTPPQGSRWRGCEFRPRGIVSLPGQANIRVQFEVSFPHTTLASEPLVDDRPAVLGYASVPRDEGIDGPELAYQVETIHAACDEGRWRLVDLVRDYEPVSGKGSERPGLGYALERITQGHAACLVVAELYRLTPSVTDLRTLLDWFEQSGARLVALDVGLDTGTQEGRRTARTLAEVIGWQRERRGRGTREGLAAVRAAGRPVSRPSVKDQPELRERIQRMRGEGLSLLAIADRLNAENVPTLRGGAKWRPSSVQVAAGYKRPRGDRASKLPGTPRVLLDRDSDPEANSAA